MKDNLPLFPEVSPYPCGDSLFEVLVESDPVRGVAFRESLPLPHFSWPSPVVRWRQASGASLKDNGIVSLPGVALWALGLNAGDLVTVVAEETSSSVRLAFRSFAAGVRSAHGCCDPPWPYVEEILRLPMAAIDAAGALVLPAELMAQCAWRAGDRLLLRGQVEPAEAWFTLEPSGELRARPELAAEALYTLPLEPGSRVTLPADALWALVLDSGGPVVCRTGLARLEGKSLGILLLQAMNGSGPVEEVRRLLKAVNDEAPAARLEWLGEGSVVQVSPQGSLPLPEAVLAPYSSEPGAQVRLTLRLTLADTTFRLEPFPALR